MNKFKRTLAASLMLAMVFTFFCCPVETQAANNEKLIVGTWFQVGADRNGGKGYGNTLVFNSDGTGKYGEEYFIYGIVSGKGAIVYSGNTIIIDYFISNNGKTIIIDDGKGYGFKGLYEKLNEKEVKKATKATTKAEAEAEAAAAKAAAETFAAEAAEAARKAAGLD